MVTHECPEAGTVVVTGASSGIGEACALRLDQLGFRVFAGVRREVDGTALRCKASDRLTPVLLDVTDAASIESARAFVAAALGETGLTGLVNNAGIAVAGPLEFLSVAEIRRQLEVNVIGQIAVTQAFLPFLRHGRGHIVNIGSLGGRVAIPFNAPYHASKFALEALTDCLRIELRPWGVLVSIIEPGAIATPLWEKSIGAVKDTFKDLPRSAQHLYGPAIPAVCEVAARVGKAGTPTDEVVRTIVHALTAKKPRTRYLVGRGARLGAVLFKWLPDQLRDLLISRWLPTYP